MRTIYGSSIAGLRVLPQLMRRSLARASQASHRVGRYGGRQFQYSVLCATMVLLICTRIKEHRIIRTCSPQLASYWAILWRPPGFWNLFKSRMFSRRRRPRSSALSRQDHWMPRDGQTVHSDRHRVRYAQPQVPHGRRMLWVITV